MVPHLFGSVDPTPDVKNEGKSKKKKKNDYYIKSEPKKVAYLLGLGTHLKIFFFLINYGLKSIW